MDMDIDLERMTLRGVSKVKDKSLAVSGRNRIQDAEKEMLGLMTCRAMYAPSMPLKDVKITGCLDLTIHTAVLIETLIALGAEVRWCSSDMLSTDDEAAAAIANNTAATVFAWRGETLDDYWWCIQSALDWGTRGGPDFIVDNGGDAALSFHHLILEGVKAEHSYKNSKTLPELSSTENEQLKQMISTIRVGFNSDPQRFSKMKAAGLVGITDGSEKGVMKLSQMEYSNTLRCPVFNSKNALTKTMLSSMCGPPTFPDVLMPLVDERMENNKKLSAVVCGYGNVGRNCAIALKGKGLTVFVTEIDPICDPICALQAASEGFKLSTLDSVVSTGDLFVTTMGNKCTINVGHMLKMKSDAILCNCSYLDNEIDMVGLQQNSRASKIPLGPQKDRWTFRRTTNNPAKRIIILNEGRGNYMKASSNSIYMSCFLTNHVMSVLELWKEKDSGKYHVWDEEKQRMSTTRNRVHVLPQNLVEKVASFHLQNFGDLMPIRSRPGERMQLHPTDNVPAGLPRVKDWTNEPDAIRVSIRKQDSSLPSDWAFAAATAYEYMRKIFYPHETQRTFSAQQLELMHEVSPGWKYTSHCVGFGYIGDNGIALESEFPSQSECRPTLMTTQSNLVYRLSIVELLPDDDEDVLKRMLQHHPIAVGLRGGKSLRKLGKEVFHGCTSEDEEAFYYSFVLMGYGRDPITMEDVFRIQSSWGLDWGDNGIGKVAMGANLLLDPAYVVF